MKSIKLSDVASLVQGRLCGDQAAEIRGAAILRDAIPGEITFAESRHLVDELAKCKATAVIVPRDVAPEHIAYIQVADVRTAFAQVVSFLRPRHVSHVNGVSPLACVSPRAALAANVKDYAHATIDDDVCIGPNCVVHSGARIMAGCRLGTDVTIHANTVLCEDTNIGDRSIVHANAVLGAWGFGYETVDGKHELGPQLGNVVIGADVHIGAGSTIDRGTYGSTTIGDGTKIDNQVMIAHNCRIGRYNLICSQVGVAGSVTTGDYVVMAGQVGVRDHTSIVDEVVIAAQAGVGQDIDKSGSYFGTPALPSREQLQMWMAQRKLPKLRQQIKELQRQVNNLLGAGHTPKRKGAA